MTKKLAFIFPGQGAQYPGMGKDFAAAYPEARQTFEEAEDLLGRKLTQTIFEGPENVLTETRNSQVAIYIVSIALLRVLEKQFPHLVPYVCAGLSLGEYTALTASKRLAFSATLPLVQWRGEFMNQACEVTKGTMAVVLGLNAEDVIAALETVHLPRDLWIANFNSPGQVVLSGTAKGIEEGTKAVLAKGAKRVLPLQVHGAFHSGLMQDAERKLSPYIQETILQKSTIDFVMNVPGDFVRTEESIRDNLIKQVTHSVRWEQGIRAIGQTGPDYFIEIGCGKTLAGLNKRIGVSAPTLSIEKVEDLSQFEKMGII